MYAPERAIFLSEIDDTAGGGGRGQTIIPIFIGREKAAAPLIGVELTLGLLCVQPRT